MNSKVVRLYLPPKPTLIAPYAQIKWMFFQLEAEHVEPRASAIRYGKNKYLQFVFETKAYYAELEEDPRFYLEKYWEVDALIRFNKWLLEQGVKSKTRYNIYKLVRQVMDMAYALRVIDTVVYHAPMFKGVSETDERAAYAEDEQEIINACVAKWIGLAESVVRGYTPTGEGVPYRKKDYLSSITIDGKDYNIAEAARAFGIEHERITARLKQGWTPRQAVGVESSPNAPSLNWTLNGVVYQSRVQVAKAFGLSSDVIRYRIEKGWTPEQIVGLAPEPEKDLSKVTGKAKPTTVDGRMFDSLKQAVQYYGVKYGAAKQRLGQYGWSLQEALELKEREQPGTKIAVEGVEYPSISAAALAYEISASGLCNRLRKGYTPEQAVGIVPIQVLKKDERALLWMFENEYGGDAYEMLSDFHRRRLTGLCPEHRLLKLFARWGVWPYIDDRLVMPLAVEMAILTGLNVEALKELEIDSYQAEHRLTGQSVIFYRKRRSGSRTRSEDRELHLPMLELEELYLKETVTERVHRVFLLLLAITGKIRNLAPPEISRRLFIFEDVARSRQEGCRVIVPLEPKGKAGHWYRRFCNDEGLYRILGPKFNFNVSRCRPTLATNMVLAGADMFQVQVALGHESIQTTATYLDERRLRPAFNRTVSMALENISRRSQELHGRSSAREISPEGCKERGRPEFHETLSGCGCLDPYRPSDAVKKVTGFQEGSVCKYWNMCLLCDCAVITEHSLPKLIVYRNRVAAALELDSPSIRARKELYLDVLKLINGVLQPDVIFPLDVIEHAKCIAVSMDDLLIDQLIYQGV